MVKLFRRNWMVSLEQVHDTLSEVGHVFTNHESEVTGIDLFVVDNTITDGVTCPARVSKVSKRVYIASEHGDGDTGNVLKRDQISCPLLVSFEEVRVVVCIYLEAILAYVLSIVQDRFHRGTVWLVTHVDSKTIWVVKIRLVCHKEFRD